MVESIAVAAGYYVTLRCDPPLPYLESENFVNERLLTSKYQVRTMHIVRHKAPLFDRGPLSELSELRPTAAGEGQEGVEANVASSSKSGPVQRTSRLLIQHPSHVLLSVLLALRLARGSPQMNAEQRKHIGIIDPHPPPCPHFGPILQYVLKIHATFRGSQTENVKSRNQSMF